MIETGSLHTHSKILTVMKITHWRCGHVTRDTWHVTRGGMWPIIGAEWSTDLQQIYTLCTLWSLERWAAQTQTHNLETRNKFRVSGGRSFIILSPASHPGWSRRAKHIWRHNATQIDWALQNLPNWEQIQAGAMWWEYLYLFSVVLVLRGRAGGTNLHKDWSFTMTEKAPSILWPIWKCLLVISNLRHILIKTLI